MRNPDYDPEGLALTIGAIERDLSDVSARLLRLKGGLMLDRESYSPYWHDHAAEQMVDAAEKLEEQAKRLRVITRYTQYPPANV